jgi:site-specific DNA-methyltransferase (adenine-specific)
MGQLEWNKYHLMDVVDGLKTIEDDSVDIVLVDPPYNIKKDFGDCKDNLSINDYVDWCDLWIKECVRIMKPSASLYIYGFSEILAHLSVRVPLDKRWLIWHYTNKTVPSYNGWQRSHESIIYAWKDKPIFNKDEIRVPYTETFIKNAANKKRPSSKTSRYGSKETIYNMNENGALPRDVFTDISALAGGAGVERYFLYDGLVYLPSQTKEFDIDKIIKHPTQKPFKLTEKLLLSSKPPKGGKIVIPFGGSGSEGVVSTKLGLDFIGFDTNQDYIQLSNGAIELFKKLF